MIHHPKLQPLRIPSGWLVSWNSFHEVDPTEQDFILFDGGSLFAAENAKAKIAIDMEFLPKNLDEGMYVVSYAKIAASNQRELLGTFSTQHRQMMVDELERFMLTLVPAGRGEDTPAN